MQAAIPTSTASSLAISGVTFDPTLLANGDYKIEIKAPTPTTI